MIVTCASCETSFQLDESRVPVQGIRVRCSRCKEAFFLQHPSASQSQVVHEVAQEAVVRGGTPSPGTTQDLTDSAVRSAAKGRAQEDINNEDENDWEFSVDPHREVEEDVAAPVAAAEPDMEIDEGASDLGEDDLENVAESPPLAVEQQAEAEAEDQIEIDQSILDSVGLDTASDDEGSDFGTVDDDFSNMMDEGDLESAVDLREGADVETGMGSGDPLAASQARESFEGAGSYATVGTSDDLGDPENWDLLNDDTDGAGRSDPGAILGRINLTTMGANAQMGPLPDLAANGEPWSDELYGPERAGPGRMMTLLGQAGTAAGWLVAAGLAALVFVGAGMPTAGAFTPELGSVVLADAIVDGLRFERIETASGERLLRVSGRMHNPTRRTIDLGGALIVSLQEWDGRRIDNAVGHAGLPVSERRLRELPPAELDAVLADSIAALGSGPLRPNAERNFEAILPDHWPQAARFTVEVASNTSPIVAPLDAGEAFDADAFASEALVEGGSAEEAAADALAEEELAGGSAEAMSAAARDRALTEGTSAEPDMAPPLAPGAVAPADAIDRH